MKLRLEALDKSARNEDGAPASKSQAHGSSALGLQDRRTEAAANVASTRPDVQRGTPSEGSQQLERGAGITRHIRYLSEFQDNVIRLDVSHHQQLGKTFHAIDLHEQLVACNGGRSHYTRPRPLLDFPDLAPALKVALNRTLERHHRGSISTEVRQCVRTFLRIVAWMSRHCVYSLADLDRDLVKLLVQDVAVKSWDKALEQNIALHRLLGAARVDLDLMQRIYDRHRNSTPYRLPIETFESLLGMPLYEWSIPLSIYQELATIEGDARPIERTVRQTNAGASHYALQHLMRTLNDLSLSTPGSIKFLPFANVLRAAKEARNAAQAKLKNELDGAMPACDSPSSTEAQPDARVGLKPTINLSTEECVRIFDESLKWLYDYAPVVLATVEMARNLMSELEVPSPHYQKGAWARVYAFYEREAAKVDLPIRSISERNHGAQSLRHLVKLLHYALFVQLGLNTARRVNELIGRRNVPYGLYRGALQLVRKDPPLYRLDSYVSKGPQAWMVFPANKLVADTYAVLERLYELHEPFDAPEFDATRPVEQLRKEKLFTVRDILPGTLTDGAEREHSNDREKFKFLKLAGVDQERFKKSIAPFRRMFSVLFMRRYDLPERPALEGYLGHLDRASASAYYNDRSITAPGESLAELLEPDYVDEELLEELAKAEFDYMAEQLHRMLEGEAIGGGFPVIAAKLLKKLSADASFVPLSNELKAGVLAKRLHDLGMRASPLLHTCCMAGSPRATGEQAKCYWDGSLHHEEATPTKCSGCVHSCPSGRYLQRMHELLEASERMLAAPALMPAVRQAHERRLTAIKHAIETERKAAERNKNLFAKIQQSWAATMAARVLGERVGPASNPPSSTFAQ